MNEEVSSNDTVFIRQTLGKNSPETFKDFRFSFFLEISLKLLAESAFEEFKLKV